MSVQSFVKGFVNFNSVRSVCSQEKIFLLQVFQRNHLRQREQWFLLLSGLQPVTWSGLWSFSCWFICVVLPKSVQKNRMNALEYRVRDCFHLHPRKAQERSTVPETLAGKEKILHRLPATQEEKKKNKLKTSTKSNEPQCAFLLLGFASILVQLEKWLVICPKVSVLLFRLNVNSSPSCCLKTNMNKMSLIFVGVKTKTRS